MRPTLLGQPLIFWVTGQCLPFREFGIQEGKTAFAASFDFVYNGIDRSFFLDLLTDESPKKILSCFVVLGGSHIYKVIYEF